MNHYYKIILMTLLAGNAVAAPYVPQSMNAVASLRLGWDWAQVGKSQHVQLVRTDPSPDYFKTTQGNSSALMYGGFLGLEFTLQNDYVMHWQSGIAYYQSNSFQTKGIDYFFSLQQFGDKKYSYQIKNQRLMFENKYLLAFTPWISGYLLGGVGVGFNKAYDYDETPLNNTTPTTGTFNSTTTASFSYSLGLGVEGVIADKVTLGIGYQFSDLGKTSLGPYSAGNTQDTLNMPNTLTNELVLLLSLVF